MVDIDSTQKYEIDEAVETYPAGDEIMVVHVGRDEIHKLNQSAGAIMDLCRGRTASELVHEMHGIYPGAPIEQVQADVLGTLADLLEKGVLRASEA